MKVLVTGGAGFVAQHLRRELLSNGHEAVLSDVVFSDLKPFVIADLTDAFAIRDLVAATKPDAVVHLGAISFIPDAMRNPDLLERINVGGTEHLITALAAEAPQARFLFISTAQVLLPTPSAYATSKCRAEQSVLRLAKKTGLDCMIVRPSNHTGPGQSERFVVPGFVKQALEIKSGRRKCFTTGNLDSVRDFTDVRDVVRAYRILLERGSAGTIYELCSLNRQTVASLLDEVARIVGVKRDAVVCQDQWRPADASPELNCSMLENLGWHPHISLSKTISDICDYYQEQKAHE